MPDARACVCRGHGPRCWLIDATLDEAIGTIKEIASDFAPLVDDSINGALEKAIKALEEAHLSLICDMETRGCVSKWGKEEDECACEGCGCVPGEGRTEGCSHPEGCGWTGA